jgi:hypothetical protein
MVSADDFDYPIVFLFSVTIGVIGFMAVLSWLFASLGWSGPLGLLKGGVMTGGGPQS